jgi:hypothetical protein
MTGDLWEVRTLPGGLSLELRGDPPGLVIVQGSPALSGDDHSARVLGGGWGPLKGRVAGLQENGDVRVIEHPQHTDTEEAKTEEKGLFVVETLFHWITSL